MAHSIAALASGSGSTIEVLVHATQDGRVDAEVGLVICSKPPEEAGVYDRITKLNQQYNLDIETAWISGKTHPKGNIGRGQTLAESEEILKRVMGFDHVALLGYMRMVRGALLTEFGWQDGMYSPYQAKMSNSHPAPLPETQDTYGSGASERVLELGMTVSRHTMHIVSANIDEGPIIAEHPVPVFSGDTKDTLFERVQVVEKAMYPTALDDFLRHQIEFRLAQSMPMQ